MADMGHVWVTITGKQPGLLMHRFPMVPPPIPLEKMEPEDQAEFAAYRMPPGDDTCDLYLPGLAVQRGLIGSATYSKGKGRASLQKQVSAGLFVTPLYIPFITPADGKYQVDGRPVTIPATKGRVMRFRPWLESWSATFELEWDASLLKPDQVREVVDNLGQLVGLLDFRPEKKGPFGRFTVDYWADRDPSEPAPRKRTARKRA